MLDNVPPVVADTLAVELDPGEPVLWHAVPSLIQKLRDPIIAFLLGILIVVLVVGVLWMHHLAAPLGKLGQSLEVSVGLIIYGGFFLQCAVALLFIRRLYRRTLYVITDRRAILIQMLFRRRIQSFTGEQLIRAVRFEDKHGGGDIIFERNVGFIGLKDIRAVATLLRQTYEGGAKV